MTNNWEAALYTCCFQQRRTTVRVVSADRDGWTLCVFLKIRSSLKERGCFKVVLENSEHAEELEEFSWSNSIILQEFVAQGK